MRLTIVLALLLSLLTPVGNVFAGPPVTLNTTFFLNETDSSSRGLFAAFDLRDRESFLQITNIESGNIRIHIQIYDVANLCNENDFFDVLTPADTHIYNLRDILTNDENPSGVDLPDNAYGIVVVTAFSVDQVSERFLSPIVGNFRIIDNAGYEYRTNAQGFPVFGFQTFVPQTPNATFNFNSESGVVLSDVFGIPLSFDEGDEFFEASLDSVLETFAAVDVDILDNNEVLFSCRDVIFACVDENSPLLEELIVLAGQDGGIPGRSSASVARFEYGINDAVPNSKGGELLCPGNIINEGVVRLTAESAGEQTFDFAGYIGLNNGNGRGSLDSFFTLSIFSTEQM